MQNQELYSNHPSIVRSELWNFVESDLNKVKLPLLLTEVELDWNLKRLKGSSCIFIPILFKYHAELKRVNSKHPFCCIISELSLYWDEIYDFIYSTAINLNQFLFLKEFILEVFTITGLELIWHDLLDFIRNCSKDLPVMELVREVLEIIPKFPVAAYFNISQKLINVANAHAHLGHKHQLDILRVLDLTVTRLELGYPIRILTSILVNYEIGLLNSREMVAMTFVAICILSVTIDKELSRIWLSILYKLIQEFNDDKELVPIIKRCALWALLKIKTDKTCQESKIKIFNERNCRDFNRMGSEGYWK